jgi:hypothetical protein
VEFLMESLFTIVSLEQVPSPTCADVIHVRGDLSVAVQAYVANGMDWVKKSLESRCVCAVYRAHPQCEKITVVCARIYVNVIHTSTTELTCEFLVEVLLDNAGPTETIESSAASAVLLEKPDAEWNF